MDSNSRPSGGDPTAAAAGADSIAIPDWRSQLMPEARQRIVTKITDALKRHLPEGLNLDEIQKIAVRFEEKIYSAATSQPDYLRKISLKMLSMETKTQGPRINPASNPNHQNLQNPNPGSGAMQIPQNFQLNSTNQSMPAGTQPPAGSMTSLFPPPAGSMTSLFPPPAGMKSLTQPPAGMNPLTQPPPGMNPLAQPPPGMISLAQHQMMRQYLAQQQMSSGLTDQPNMTAGGMTQNQLNLLQQQKYLLQMHLNQIQQFQMMNMNNNNNDNMMVRSGGNNVNNNMNNMQLRGMQQMSRQNQNQQPIQQGLNCNNNINNNNNNDNMMQLQQHQRSVRMLQTQNSAAMDSTAQKGSPSELEVVCQKQQILPQTVSTSTMMSQGGMMMSQPNKGLKQQQKLMKQNQVEVHELGLWVNPAAKIFVLLVIILFLLHTVHELGFCIINM